MASAGESPELPVVVLGAGYAGLTVAREVRRRSRGRLPVVLIDRHPVHVLRTELYEVGRLAESEDLAPWALPLTKLLEGKHVRYREGTVTAIDVDRHRVRLGDEELEFGSLAICLGSVGAYFGVPGAKEHTYSVYRLGEARRLALALGQSMHRSAELPPERRPRFVVVGGGSTGTELAAEIQTTDWSRITGGPTREPEVVLIAGALPFLTGFPPSLVRHAREILRASGVMLFHGVNVSRIEPGKVHLADGTILACDLVAWCAGVEAPPLVRDLPVPHGHAGRIAVDEHLEVPGHPGVFAVGDVIELKDPRTQLLVPAMAQAALAEGRTAGANIVARRAGEALAPFRYRERGVVIQLGSGRAAGRLRRLTIWGAPAALLKRLTQTLYADTADRGGTGLL